MKISGVSSTASLTRLPQANTSLRGSAGVSAGSHVQLSEEAGWIQGLQDGAEQLSQPRMDLVSEIRASLADGSFEASVDMEAVLSGLMGDL